MGWGLEVTDCRPKEGQVVNNTSKPWNYIFYYLRDFFFAYMPLLLHTCHLVAFKDYQLYFDLNWNWARVYKEKIHSSVMFKMVSYWSRRRFSFFTRKLSPWESKPAQQSPFHSWWRSEFGTGILQRADEGIEIVVRVFDWYGKICRKKIEGILFISFILCKPTYVLVSCGDDSKLRVCTWFLT
jgi:hypothetical protein